MSSRPCRREACLQPRLSRCRPVPQVARRYRGRATHLLRGSLRTSLRQWPYDGLRNSRSASVLQSRWDLGNQHSSTTLDRREATPRGGIVAAGVDTCRCASRAKRAPPQIWPVPLKRRRVS
eukprot:scaffold43339_cov32-Tisochrysis_lutea.AAC.1